MIFMEGTILKPKSILHHFNHKAYIPIGNCVSLIDNWQSQGYCIVYCTSQKGKHVEEMAELLIKFHFAGSRLYFRGKDQTYKDIIEEVQPSILIEDDCKSIGGSWQMCITNISPNIKANIKSIVVKEFHGIDDLPFTF
jgi:hypothetical protein